MLKVTAAAIRSTVSGKVYHLPIPNRHHNIIAHMVECGEPTPISGPQGFILSDGSFVDRFTALKVAEEAGQIVEKHPCYDRLFSEDMW